MTQNRPEKLLISACLLGQPVRYDGKSKGLTSELAQAWLSQLQQQNRLVVICPEIAGGLPVPRPPAEYQLESGMVITQQKVDVTAEFRLGAEKALELCQQHDIKFALLKANSPSCGTKQVYDGSFSGNLIAGMGLTARLLTENGIDVFSELEIDTLSTKIK